MMLIDGHNLVFADGEAKAMLESNRPGDARRRVVELVELHARTSGQRATIVFDGPGAAAPTPETGSVRCVFAGRGGDADAEILALLRANTGRREIIVVTGDRSLASAARRLGAKTMTSAAFLLEVSRLARRRRSGAAPEPAGKRRGPSSAEVEYWLKIFSDEDADDARKEDSRERRKK